MKKLLFVFLASFALGMVLFAVSVSVRNNEAIVDVREDVSNLTYEVDQLRYAVIPYSIPYSDLQDVSVRVDVVANMGEAHGSGVLVTRQVGDVTRSYVWTAGHVTLHLLNPDGTFRTATIHQERRVRGKYVCDIDTEVKVIAYSPPEEEDLALLEVLRDNFQPITVSATFDENLQGVGTELVHVGSTLGIYNSVSLGIVSQTDRDIEGKRYEQTSCMGYPGSSGGGVYKTNGVCIGLLTRGAGPGLNFIVPARRMASWAKKVHIEWAMNPGIKVPLVRAPSDLEKVVPAPKAKLPLEVPADVFQGFPITTYHE